MPTLRLMWIVVLKGLLWTMLMSLRINPVIKNEVCSVLVWIMELSDTKIVHLLLLLLLTVNREPSTVLVNVSPVLGVVVSHMNVVAVRILLADINLLPSGLVHHQVQVLVVGLHPGHQQGDHHHHHPDH